MGNSKDTVTIADGLRQYTNNLTVTHGTDLCRDKALLKKLGFLTLIKLYLHQKKKGYIFRMHLRLQKQLIL